LSCWDTIWNYFWTNWYKF